MLDENIEDDDPDWVRAIDLELKSDPHYFEYYESFLSLVPSFHEWRRRERNRTRPRRRGRNKGHMRPSDHSQYSIEKYADAARAVWRLHAIWRVEYKKCYRKQSPTAVEIAAVRYGLFDYSVGQPVPGFENNLKNRRAFNARFELDQRGAWSI